MTQPDELTQLLQQRTWDKELNLWVGSERQLRPMLEGLKVDVLDLLDVVDDGWPTEDDEIRQQFTRAIRQRLKAIPRERGQRLVLMVFSAGLLARFGVGVREFYDWFCDDFSMVFLVIEGRCSDAHWPDEVECVSNRLIDYFSDNSALIKRQFGV